LESAPKAQFGPQDTSIFSSIYRLVTLELQISKGSLYIINFSQ